MIRASDQACTWPLEFPSQRVAQSTSLLVMLRKAAGAGAIAASAALGLGLALQGAKTEPAVPAAASQPSTPAPAAVTEGNKDELKLVQVVFRYELLLFPLAGASTLSAQRPSARGALRLPHFPAPSYLPGQARDTSFPPTSQARRADPPIFQILEEPGAGVGRVRQCVPGMPCARGFGGRPP